MTPEETLREVKPKPKTREEMAEVLKNDGWKLVHQERFIRPAASFEIWGKRGNAYQIRLSWPLNGDCNGATTTEIEIDKALYMMAPAESVVVPE